MKSFTLSKYFPLNTIISDDDGPLYAIVTPFDLFHGVTKVSKRSPAHPSTSPQPLPSGRHELADDGRSDGMEEIARIKWHYWEGTKLVCNSQVMDMTTLMPADNITRMCRTFVGPDGQSYTWYMGIFTSTLKTKHGPHNKSVTVAQFHLATIAGTRARLEVKDVALPALDLIIITWIFIDQRRDAMPWRP